MMVHSSIYCMAPLYMPKHSNRDQNVVAQKGEIKIYEKHFYASVQFVQSLFSEDMTFSFCILSHMVWLVVVVSEHTAATLWSPTYTMCHRCGSSGGGSGVS